MTKMKKRLRIGINGRSLGGHIRDGISNVATNLFLNFPIDMGIEWVVFSPHQKLFPEIEERNCFIHIQPEKQMRGGVWFYTKLISDLKKNPVDIFWSPNQLLPPCIPKITKTILTVHDFTYLKFPETMNPLCAWNLRLRGAASIRKADILVAVSKTTAEGIKRIANLNSKIKVIHNGVDSKLFFPERLRGYSLAGLDRPDYFLSVGSIEPRKNLEVLLEAYETLFEETAGDCPRWVIVYSNTWNCDALLARMKTGKASKGILLKRNVKTDELRRIYSNALALLFPSIYEGFGLPLLEAMACGCPVIASDIAVFREIGDDAALFADPRNGRQFFEILQHVSSHSEIQTRLVNRGYVRVKEFSWEKAAAMYYFQFLSLASRGKECFLGRTLGGIGNPES